jgi:hypothetical protein
MTKRRGVATWTLFQNGMKRFAFKRVKKIVVLRDLTR